MQFIANGSPASMPSEVVRFTVDTRNNIVRLVKDAGRAVNKLEAN